jgi:hypothetical protein
MGKLGMKISNAFSSLGNKTNKLTSRIGDKTNRIIKETKGVAGVLQKKAGQIQNTAVNAFDKTKDLVNKIPDINEKAIHLGQTIVKKSGGITDVLRKAGSIGDKLLNGAVQLGGGDIPIIGDALRLGARATHQLNVGATKLDQARDTGARKLDKYATVSRSSINDIEKVNQRKKDDLIAQDNGPEQNFV